ncbi:MAG: trypsin-like peptidase domain-containing protein [Methylophilaceae bacterium]
MTKLLCALLLCIALPVEAAPTDELLQKINAHVVRVQVALANGAYGVGSGVVVAKDQVVTNCHVIANATNIGVVSNGENFSVSAIKPDWHHDVCILKVEGLNAPVATIGSSKNLKYEQAVFAVGYPDFSMSPCATFGFVKGLFRMDDSVVIRATSTFRQGASGGGVFDDDGNLVGVIALKSPGRNAYYYNLPVEWVQALLSKPEQAINTNSELPFWAENEQKWPYFMRVVQPYLTEDWQALLTVASQWAAQDPNSSEALFYLAAAEYATNDISNAENHLHQVVAINKRHSQAIYYLALIAEENGKHTEALNNVALLDHLDVTTADQLKLAMGITGSSR